MAPFNLLGEVFKPISMSFRHFGNVLSGMVISALVYAALILANQALFGLIPGVVGRILGNIPFLAVGVRPRCRCISTGSPARCRHLYSVC